MSVGEDAATPLMMFGVGGEPGKRPGERRGESDSIDPRREDKDVSDSRTADSAIARGDLHEQTGLELTPEEEAAINAKLQEYESVMRSLGHPPLTEQQRADLIAKIISEMMAPSSAPVSLPSLKQAPSEETKRMTPPTTPDSRAMSGLLGRAERRSEKSSLSSPSSLSSISGSTSAESKQSTPDKVSPSASPLPPTGFSLVQLQEEVKKAKAEMERTEDIHINNDSRETMLSAEVGKFLKQHFGSETAWFDVKKLRAAKQTGDMSPLTPLEQQFFPVWKPWGEASILQGRRDQNKIDYENARNHYLDLEQKLYAAQCSADASLRYELALALCERCIPIVLKELGRGEHNLLKFSIYTAHVDLLEEGKIAQLKQNIYSLWDRYFHLTQERRQSHPDFVAPSASAAPVVADQEKSRLEALKKDLTDTQTALDYCKTTRDRLQREFNEHTTRVVELEQKLERCRKESGRIPNLFGMAPTAALQRRLDNKNRIKEELNVAIVTKKEFAHKTSSEFEDAKLEEELKLHPEERLVMLWKQHLSSYKSALNNLMRFDDSLKLSDAEAYYGNNLTHLARAKIALLSPEEQSHRERLVASGTPTATLLKLAMGRKNRYISRLESMNYQRNYAESSGGGRVGGSSSYHTNPLGNYGQQQLMNQQQQGFNNWYNGTQSTLISGAMSQGLSTTPYVYR